MELESLGSWEEGLNLTNITDLDLWDYEYEDVIVPRSFTSLDIILFKLSEISFLPNLLFILCVMFNFRNMKRTSTVYLFSLALVHQLILTNSSINLILGENHGIFSSVSIGLYRNSSGPILLAFTGDRYFNYRRRQQTSGSNSPGSQITFAIACLIVIFTVSIAPEATYWYHIYLGDNIFYRFHRWGPAFRIIFIWLPVTCELGALVCTILTYKLMTRQRRLAIRANRYNLINLASFRGRSTTPTTPSSGQNETDGVLVIGNLPETNLESHKENHKLHSHVVVHTWLYFICWTPTCLLETFVRFVSESDLPAEWFAATYFLCKLNSVISPFVNALFVQEFYPWVKSILAPLKAFFFRHFLRLSVAIVGTIVILTILSYKHVQW